MTENAEEPSVEQGEEEEESNDGLIIGGIISILVLGALASNEPRIAFLIVVVTGILWLFLSESGTELRNDMADEMMEAQQQQSQNTSSVDPTLICDNCGWQNPKDNNFCHDCGQEL